MPNNQLTVWKYPSLTRVIDIPAHESRILHSTLSPDGQTLASKYIHFLFLARNRCANFFFPF